MEIAKVSAFLKWWRSERNTISLYNRERRGPQRHRVGVFFLILGAGNSRRTRNIAAVYKYLLLGLAAVHDDIATADLLVYAVVIDHDLISCSGRAAFS